MLLSKTNKADIPLYVGSFLMTLFILVVMIDPTNTLLHKKDIAFVLTVAYNMVLFKPDFSKLPYIMLMFCAVAVPWIFSTMRMTPVDPDEVLAAFKSIAPVVLLLWTRNYNMVKLSRFPVVLCCFISLATYIAMSVNPLIERGVWMFMQNIDDPVTISRRTILGVEILGFYLKSCVSFIFVFSYYMLYSLDKTKRNVANFIFLIIIFSYFMISGTRSTMLMPFFLFIVIASYVFKNSRYIKYVMYPLIFVLAIAFVTVLLAAIMETDELSNTIKYGHLDSYAALFDENPLFLIFGQGPGATFYSEGFGEVVVRTEWSYLDLIRNYGVFSLIIVFVFAKPIFSFWKYRKQDDFNYCMFWSYLVYLLIAGTNPLLMSSTGMIVLLMAYSYEDKIKNSINNIDDEDNITHI